MLASLSKMFPILTKRSPALRDVTIRLKNLNGKLLLTRFHKTQYKIQQYDKMLRTAEEKISFHKLILFKFLSKESTLPSTTVTNFFRWVLLCLSRQKIFQICCLVYGRAKLHSNKISNRKTHSFQDHLTNETSQQWLNNSWDVYKS